MFFRVCNAVGTGKFTGFDDADVVVTSLVIEAQFICRIFIECKNFVFTFDIIVVGFGNTFYIQLFIRCVEACNDFTVF